MKERSRPHVDVCLVLEGTYPYVAGGVSSWVQHLVTHMPELRFGVVHISPREGYHDRGPLYDVPDNVAFVDEVFLIDSDRGEGRWAGSGPLPRLRGRRRRRAVEAFWQLAANLRNGSIDGFRRCALELAEQDEPLGVREILLTRDCWQVLVELYRHEAAEESFLTFFWSWVFAYEPLTNALTARVPDAGVFHTVSTGYAGVLAAAARVQHARPMLLTEHGIYTKERRIEIHSADWIQDWMPEESLVGNGAPYFQMFWNRHFETMSRICYAEADRILTLYGENAALQVRDGADPERISIVPNGVDVEHLDRARERFEARGGREPDAPFTVAFVGRVTPIKDVRTFLAAMRLVMAEIPDLVVRVLGPMEEDPDYAEECVRFGRELGLGESVRFEGRVSVVDELPGVDVLVLTSISEAQPLVVLEAGALGIPVVATDVGSCRELLEGRDPEDRMVGVGGLLTPIATPGATARAVLRLARDPAMRAQLGRALRQRVRTRYDQKLMVAEYRALYRSALDGAAASAPSRGRDEVEV